MEQQDIEQRTTEWKIARLGKWNASEIGNLMKTSKDGGFSDTAMSYIRKVAAERFINKELLQDIDAMEEFFRTTDITTKAMQYGTDNEPYARSLYAKVMGVEVVEVGSKPYKDTNICASPDGIAKYKEDVGCEFKCPKLETYMLYKEAFNYDVDKIEKCIDDNKYSLDKIDDKLSELETKLKEKDTKTARNEYEKFKIMKSKLIDEKRLLSDFIINPSCYNAVKLKETNEMYYWQVMTQMLCYDFKRVDFSVYHPLMQKPILINPITRNDDEIELLLGRVDMAEEIVKKLIS